jgi:calcium-dependent phosphoinositide phospholipase C
VPALTTRRPIRSSLAVAAAAAAALLTAVIAPAAHAQPSHTTATAALSFAQTTTVGVHNAYEKETYPYLADVLDSGAALVELDVWTNDLGTGWRVGHTSPFWNDNNCVQASSAADLYTGPRDTNLSGCLSDLRAWHDAHPGHRPVVVKLEMKDGFRDVSGRGPDELDALLNRYLGDAVFGPGDLTAGRYATPDAAARAGAWPQREAMAGTFLFELIPGTVEEDDPFDTLWTDTEYARHLRSLAAAGRLDEAAAFPAVHGAQSGDPRTQRYDASLRPWFVVFDGDASAYVDGGLDTAWYDDNGYLLIMTDAQNVSPAIDDTHPTEQQARDRVTRLAAEHASIASTDWYPLPDVLQMTLPRG